MAEQLGVSPQLLSMWAYNKRAPGKKDLLVLAEMFHMPLAELCHLNAQQKKGRQTAGKPGQFLVTFDDAKNSMMDVCDITTEIVSLQRQMLSGKRDFKKHREWLRRIRNYVDTI